MSEFYLSADGYEAGIAPPHGGVLTFLRFGGRDLLRPASSCSAVRDDPRNAACFVCVPYFGRLHGGLNFDTRHWDMRATLPACDPKEALHGEGWVSPWKLIDRTNKRAILRFAHDGAAQGRFPFPYLAEQRITLLRSGLSLVLSVRNTGAQPMPAAPALHPFFPDASKARVSFAASKFWTPPLRGEPGRIGEIPQALDFAGGRALPETTIDHSFSDISADVLIEGPTGKTALSTMARHLHVYAPQSEDFFCLEPLTGLPGASEFPVLAPDTEISIEMTVAAA